jgi:hypothetical protein
MWLAFVVFGLRGDGSVLGDTCLPRQHSAPLLGILLEQGSAIVMERFFSNTVELLAAEVTESNRVSEAISIDGFFVQHPLHLILCGRTRFPVD